MYLPYASLTKVYVHENAVVFFVEDKMQVVCEFQEEEEKSTFLAAFVTQSGFPFFFRNLTI